MKKLVLIAALAITGNAFAITSRLAFHVRSSGPDAFPCNAGIRHGKPLTTAGYDHAGFACADDKCLNGMRTVTGTYVSEFVNDVNANGVYFPDMMHSQFSVYNPATNLHTLGSLIATGAWIDGQWHDAKGNTITDLSGDLLLASKLVTDLVAPYAHRGMVGGVRVNNVLTSLSFILSSEQYGTNYFVDICNYKPETFCGGNCGTSDSETGGHFAYRALVSGTFSIDSVLEYIALSGLKVEAKLACDGAMVTVQGTTSVSATLSQILGANVTGEKCVTRFIFRETSNRMRLNQLQKACFEVMTEINDPEAVVE